MRIQEPIKNKGFETDRKVRILHRTLKKRKGRIGTELPDLPECHWFIAGKDKVNGVLFKAADDDSATFGVDPKLAALEMPGEGNLFTA